MYCEGSCEGHTVSPAWKLLLSCASYCAVCNMAITHGEPGQYSSVPMLSLWWWYLSSRVCDAPLMTGSS
jgi:hypothetical protein